MEDEAIIALYFQRDEAAVRETRTRYGERLRRLARDILYDRRDAEETENDTYFRAWNSIPPQRPRYFYAYLARLCRNLALNRLDWARAQRRNAPLVSLTEEMEQCVPDRLTENPADSREIGRVISVTGFGPHRLGAAGRPKWFFEREKYGGILCDIGSHQIEQYLHFAGEEDATVQSSRIANYAHPEYPELEDFGDCALTGAKGSTNYFRVDWFNPDGLRTWGDGRTFILGTEGFIEIRKYINLASDAVDGDHVYLVNGKGEQYFNASGTVGFPFFGQLILDCLNRTENAMTQAHAFKAAELCLLAQEGAVKVTGLK